MIHNPEEALVSPPKASEKRRSVIGSRNRESIELSNPNNLIMGYECILIIPCFSISCRKAINRHLLITVSFNVHKISSLQIKHVAKRQKSSALTVAYSTKPMSD